MEKRFKPGDKVIITKGSRYYNRQQEFDYKGNPIPQTILGYCTSCFDYKTERGLLYDDEDLELYQHIDPTYEIY